ncbi:MAG: hypothetical protein GX039_07100 [Clostridia bacterium]|nr:hypothetical protein [Clostridia bacterium]
MSLASCNCQCSFFYDRTCELSTVLADKVPLICPYRQLQPANLSRPGTISPGWEKLPHSFTSTRHERFL